MWCDLSHACVKQTKFEVMLILHVR